MADPLTLSVRLTMDRAGFQAGARDGAAAIDRLSQATAGAAATAGTMGRAHETASRATVAAATSSAAAIERVAAATAAVQASAGRDSLGLAIGRSTAAATAAATELATALDDLRSRFDPLHAATRRYETALAEVREAHRLGAIDAQVLIARETELRTAYERTTAAITGRAAAQKSAIGAVVADQTIIPNRGADVAAYGAGLDELRAKYNPLWAAGQRYRTTVEDIARAERVGAITSTEATAARARAKEATGAEVEALRRAKGGADDHTAAMRRQAMQAQLLVPQLNDVAVSLAMGMNPLMVAMQQGTQITQIYGGFGNTVKAAAAWLTPMRIGLGLVGVAAAVATKAAIDYADALRETQTVIAGVGRGAGVTASDVERIATVSSASAGMSVAAARSIATEYVRTGRIGGAAIEGLTGLTKDFAATIGSDVTTATSILAEAFADPAKGATTLSESYHLVDWSAAQYVRRLMEQGRVTEAQAALQGALKGRLVDAGETVAWYTKLWDDLSASMGNYLSVAGRALAGGPNDAVSKVQDKLDAARQALAIAEEIQQRGFDTSLLRGFPGADAIRPDVTMGRAEVARLEAELEATKNRANERAAADRQRALDDQTFARTQPFVEAATPDETRRRQIEAELAVLRQRRDAETRTFSAETRETPAVAAQIAETTAATTAAIEARTHALRTAISEDERAAALQRIDIALMQTRNPLERAALEAERARVQQAGQVVSPRLAAIAAEQAYARVLGETIAQARGATTDLEAETAARARVNALVAAGAITAAQAATELRVEAETRQLVAAAARAEGDEKRRLLETAEALAAAIRRQADEEQRRSAVQALRSQDDEIERIRAEIAAVTLAEPGRARYLASLQAERDIRDKGLVGDDAARYRAAFVALADYNAELGRTRAAWGEVQSVGGSAIDTIVDGLRSGEGFGEKLADDLAAEMTKLAITNPLKNRLLGENLPTWSDVGGVLGLFGGGGAKGRGGLPTAVTTAQISAATVIVNGSAVGGATGTGGIAGLTGGTSSVAANGNGPMDLSALMAVNRTGSATAVTGLDPRFAGNLTAMVAAADKQFGPGAITLNSGYRSVERQQELWQQALAKYGSPEAARQWVAPPGASQHNAGMAADLGYASPDVASWAQANAGQFGLRYRLGNEPWHIEPAGGAQAAQAQQQLAQSAGQAAQSVGSLGTGATDAAKTLMGAGTTITTAGTSLAGSTTQLAGSTQGAFQTLLSGLGGGIDLLLSGLTGIVSRIAGAGGGGGLGSIIGSLFGESTLATPVIGGLYAGGGRIVGPGTDTSDSIWIAASNDEHIVKASAARKYRPLLDAMNGDRPLPRFAGGGVVGGDRGRMVMTPSGRSDGSQGGATVVKLEQRIINTSSARVTTREESDGRGGRRSVVMIDDMVAGAVGRRGGATDRALAAREGGVALE